MNAKFCTKCREPKFITPEFFNLLSSGYYRNVCKLCMAAHSRAHHAKKPEQTALRREKYNDNVRLAEGVHSDADIVLMRVRQQDKCLYCSVDLEGAGEVDVGYRQRTFATKLSVLCAGRILRSGVVFQNVPISKSACSTPRIDRIAFICRATMLDGGAMFIGGR